MLEWIVAIGFVVTNILLVYIAHRLPVSQDVQPQQSPLYGADPFDKPHDGRVPPNWRS